MDKNAQALANEFQMKIEHVSNVIEMLDEGDTIPFIARYRKERHGAADDQVLRALSERLNYLRSLDQRREEISSSIIAQEKMTEELQAAIENAKTLSELEDIYRPYRPKRRTRATIAREKGLEKLAEAIYSQDPGISDLNELAKDYISEEKGVLTEQDALDGASDIIAEMLSDDAQIRFRVKALIRQAGFLRSERAKEGESVYGMYMDFRESIKNAQGYRVLAVNRGEKEGWLKAGIEVNDEIAIFDMVKTRVKSGRAAAQFLENTVRDAYQRLIFPSVEREIRNELTDAACENAIGTFKMNLKPLLMQPPLKNRVTLGFDPAYRTGCKLAVVDETGKVLETGVVYPTPPHNKKAEAREKLNAMIRRHNITAIAVGNGTASKESEIFVSELIKEHAGVSYMMVSEAGASVYSASPLGAQEFPEYDVSLRSAVSIARRLQDPLAELVKIDPKAIGVGQYQHDMQPSKLDEALGGVVEDCVNAVGVNLNTASASLLSYVSGLTNASAKAIVKYREENGAFKTRKDVKKAPRIGPKAFEQSAGFLRVPDSENILDNTGVHPESYDAAKKLLLALGYTLEDVKNGRVTGLVEKFRALSDAEIEKTLGVGSHTAKDIVEELIKPGRDIRGELPETMLRADVMSISDLKSGLRIKGTVRNVTDFGAFVDIGVHQDGLVHISELADRFIRHPSEVVRVGDVVDTVVLSADEKTGRISLSMKRCAAGK
ncbi:MAG: RNA-binding transcriptional accessory protein [Clostridia bacterium]|nr:RNA-binding transcriptional accessory protein [Clostridia bacterium]